MAAGPYWLARGGYYNSINPGTFTSDSYVGGNKGYFDPYYYYAFRVVMVAA